MGAEIPTNGERFARIEDRLTEVLVGLAKVDVAVAQLNGTLSDVVAEIGGAPDIHARGARDTLRTRVHRIENDNSAAAAAKAALDAVRSIRANHWSVGSKAFVLGFSGIAALASLLRLLGIGG